MEANQPLNPSVIITTAVILRQESHRLRIFILSIQTVITCALLSNLWDTPKKISGCTFHFVLDMGYSLMDYKVQI